MYILLTAVFCVALSFGVIYPLWFFSTSNPVLYTKVVLYAVLFLFFSALLRKFIISYNSMSGKDEHKKFIFTILLRLSILSVTVFSALLIITSVLNERRLAALIILIAGSAISTFLVKIRKRLADV